MAAKLQQVFFILLNTDFLNGHGIWFVQNFLPGKH